MSKLGDKNIEVAQVGPAGERGVRYAFIIKMFGKALKGGKSDGLYVDREQFETALNEYVPEHKLRGICVIPSAGSGQV